MSNHSGPAWNQQVPGLFQSSTSDPSVSASSVTHTPAPHWRILGRGSTIEPHPSPSLGDSGIALYHCVMHTNPRSSVWFFMDFVVLRYSSLKPNLFLESYSFCHYHPGPGIIGMNSHVQRTQIINVELLATLGSWPGTAS